MAKCKPDCTCGRHQKHEDSCTCGRCRVWAERRGKHEIGCSCHLCRLCPSGCTCGKHRDREYAPDREVTYYALHNRVRRVRGKVSAQSCTECQKPARHWAQIHGTDGTSPYEHYQPMCSSCHAIYDKQGRSLTEEGRQRISATTAQRWQKWRDQKVMEGRES